MLVPSALAYNHHKPKLLVLRNHNTSLNQKDEHCVELVKKLLRNFED
jgi:hypothetical protein